MPVEELVRRAEVAFREIQSEMATLAPLVAKEKGLGGHRLPRRAARAEEAADHRRRHPPLLPGADQGAGGDHPARGDRQPARPADEVPAGERGRERGEPRRPHMQPPRLIGNTGEMGEFVLPLRIPGQQGAGEPRARRLHLRRLLLAADRPRGAPRPRAPVRVADRERGLEGARDLRLEQRQRRGLGALRRGRGEALPAARRPARRPAEPADPRRPGASSIPACRAAQITREEATRILREDVGLSEGMALQEVAALHLPQPGAGDLLLLRLHPADGAARRRSSASWARSSTAGPTTISSSPRGCCHRAPCCARRCSTNSSRSRKSEIPSAPHVT